MVKSVTFLFTILRRIPGSFFISKIGTNTCFQFFQKHNDFSNFSFYVRVKNKTIKIYPADVVLIEGILVFYYPEIRNLFHLKLFVDTDSDTRLARRGNFKNF